MALREEAKPCLICGKPQVERFHPFCSRRCADVDLHRWLSGAYAVPADEDEAEDSRDAGAAGDGEDAGAAGDGGDGGAAGDGGDGGDGGAA